MVKNKIKWQKYYYKWFKKKLKEKTKKRNLQVIPKSIKRRKIEIEVPLMKKEDQVLYTLFIIGKKSKERKDKKSKHKKRSRSRSRDLKKKKH